MFSLMIYVKNEISLAFLARSWAMLLWGLSKVIAYLVKGKDDFLLGEYNTKVFCESYFEECKTTAEYWFWEI